MTAHILTIVPAGVRVPCADSSSLLDAALTAGFFPRHSCRRGECNSCEAKVIEGMFSYPRAFVPEGVRPGHCLTCMARPESDVVIEAPEVGSVPGRRLVQAGARVVAVERINHDVAIVRLQVAVAADFDFLPGQYVDVILKDGSRRSYSMANAAGDPGTIEWHVRALPGGRFSTHVFQAMKPRDLVRIEGPFGSFTLRPSGAPVILLASGTGYAPIRSMMLAHGEALGVRGATLFWGGRHKEDLYAFQEALDWESSSDSYRFVPVLSAPPPDWAGAAGFVHEVVQRQYPDLSRHEVYACGNPLMVDAARHAFASLNGLPAARFFSDAFVSVMTPEPEPV